MWRLQLLAGACYGDGYKNGIRGKLEFETLVARRGYIRFDGTGKVKCIGALLEKMARVIPVPVREWDTSHNGT